MAEVAEETITYVTIFILIACGTLIFICVSIFGKRQIMRFASRSARKPHINIGSDVPKSYKEKIHQSLEKTKSIYFEPILLSEEVQNAACSTENHYYYRMKALDAFANAVRNLQWSDSSVQRREPRQTIQLYLYCLCPSAAGGRDAVLIEKFARLYKHARHSPVLFEEKEFIRYMELLDKIIRLIKLDQRRRSNSLKAKDLEVQLKGSKRPETIISDHKREVIPLETLHHRGVDRGVAPPGGNRDISSGISSGYSSTDRSSEHGSSEQLISTGFRRV